MPDMILSSSRKPGASTRRPSRSRAVAKGQAARPALRRGKGLLGVVGGMGPAATADFYRKLIAATPAATDQEHIPVLVLADPRIGDRTAAIQSGRDDEVLAELVQRVRCLESAGVEAIAIPCNTAHYWLARLKAVSRIPFISLVEAAVAEAHSRCMTARTALMLGTSGTINTGIYDTELARYGMTAVRPDPEQQAAVDAIIAQVKGGKIQQATDSFEMSCGKWLAANDVILLACTELPLAAQAVLPSSPRLIDTTAALADACIAWAMGRRIRGM